MAYNNDTKREIWDRTGGCCHICHQPTLFTEYGKLGSSAWELDHKIPLARGGLDILSNLLAAHPSCNRSKRDGTNHIRRRHGVSGLPPSTAVLKRRAFWRGARDAIVVVVASHVIEKNKDRLTRGLARSLLKLESRILKRPFDEARVHEFVQKLEAQRAGADDEAA